MNATRLSVKRESSSDVRRAMRLANANAGLWAVGNGLVSTQLVVYLANEFGAKWLWISLILAAPRFAGLLRLGVPALVAGTRSRKLVCVGAYVLSALVLGGVPVAAVSRGSLVGSDGLAVLVGTWCAYHLCEYVGTVALWSWLGDLTPRRIRGRLLGYRERWLIMGRVAGVIVSVAITSVFTWQPLAVSAAAGAVMMLAAVVPLVAMPGVSQSPSAIPRLPWLTLANALVDVRYRRLVAFSCWFALVAGITASAQEKYRINVLAIPYYGFLLMSGGMWLGQIALAPLVGRWADRIGNRPVMIVSQLIAASGLLFFWWATPSHPWVVTGAYVAWIAYAGLNVGLDNMKLKLAPADNNAPYLAAYHAVSDLANGASILVGGLFYDRLVSGGSDAMVLYAQLFFWGWVGRNSTVLLLARINEPGAKRLSEG